MNKNIYNNIWCKMAESYYCNVCDIQLSSKFNFETHLTRLSHIKKIHISETNKYCGICNYSAKRTSHFKAHLQSKKHIDAENDYAIKSTAYSCNECGFHTNSKRGYLVHTKTKKHIDIMTCIPIQQSQPPIQTQPSHNTDVERNGDEITNANILNMFIELMNQNKDFQKSLVEFCIKENAEICKNAINGSGTNHSHNTNNSHNTQNFNINIFLNETCKDAVNINDFIESLQIDSDVIEYMGREGYVQGMTKIFFDGLGQMKVNRRPIHCTDMKRETFYIRDANSWLKDKDKTRIESAINRVIRKNQSNLHLWREKNPRYDVLNTPEYEFHLEIMMQCIGGGLDKEAINNRKIIRNLAKFTSIENTLSELKDSAD